MKIIIGIGNPGEKYRNNRHNVGHMVIDKLSQIRNSKFETRNKSQILIFKSTNFMNDSGSFVLDKTKTYHLNPNNLFVIFDDLDIKLGEYKIQFGKGPKDHNGLNDIYDKLGTNEFWHVRVGVDNRDSESKVSGEEYVLQDFSEKEKSILNETINRLIPDLNKKLSTNFYRV